MRQREQLLLPGLERVQGLAQAAGGGGRGREERSSNGDDHSVATKHSDLSLMEGGGHTGRSCGACSRRSA